MRTSMTVNGKAYGTAPAESSPDGIGSTSSEPAIWVYDVASFRSQKRDFVLES
jgi:hypothetical protein